MRAFLRKMIRPSLGEVLDGHTRRRTARVVLGQPRDLGSLILADRSQLCPWDMP